MEKARNNFHCSLKADSGLQLNVKLAFLSTMQLNSFWKGMKFNDAGTGSPRWWRGELDVFFLPIDSKILKYQPSQWIIYQENCIFLLKSSENFCFHTLPFRILWPPKKWLQTQEYIFFHNFNCNFFKFIFS